MVYASFLFIFRIIRVLLSKYVKTSQNIRQRKKAAFIIKMFKNMKKNTVLIHMSMSV